MVKSVITFIIALSFVELTNAQEFSKDIISGFGYGYIQDGNGDIPGQTFYLSGISHLNKKLSLSGRVLGTLIERERSYDQFETFERSNGANVEIDLNYHFNYWRFSIYPSLGPSLRYSSDQDIRSLAIDYNQSGRIADIDVSYNRSKSLRLGYSLGLNMDISVFSNLLVGARAAAISYADGNRYRYLAVTVKHRVWNI